MKTTRERLSMLLEQVNNINGLGLKLNYNSAYGGYLLQTAGPIPRELCFVLQKSRMTAREMEAYLLGILNGVRLSREQLFNPNIF